ncbi:thioredoxin domain-containing protein [Xanthobacter sp. TB0139]|uniref:thioredoxin domain-containing protein n=1 Tax=Xanthobacter sp. TB0139 TaxID=3459178 RepID=UPI0040394F02
MSQNRLAAETSPYLLQHKNNPVQWWAWGPEAFDEAKATGKPVLLSIGYAACHWCHVMAHESFENPAIAAVMNELFINIKVDREERPDVDQIYMNALHQMGQQGGWPLTMFLDTEGHPFWGGTYFPSEARYGRPGFADVLTQLSGLYHNSPEKVHQNAQAIASRLQRMAKPQPGVSISSDDLSGLAPRLSEMFDPVNGGLKGAPKFPQCGLLEFLWRNGVRQQNPALKATMLFALNRMSEGGIYDHLGGGFARYAVDEAWLVPHFEKMLYDNAQLLELLALAYAETGEPLFKARATETVGWLQREMMSEQGAFTASLDADSEGEEGRFYVWSAAEIEQILGPDDAAFFARFYDVTPAGNWEGKTILNRSRAVDIHAEDEVRLTPLRARLLEARASRVRPGRDDKILADWNGLMIAALARAGIQLEEPEWVECARRAFVCVYTTMQKDKRLAHSLCDGKLIGPGLASDLAAMTLAATALHEATGESTYIDQASHLLQTLEQHHIDAATGGYYLTADDAEALIMRPLSSHDEALPNYHAVAVEALLRLSALTGQDALRMRADRILGGLSGMVNRNVIAHGAMLNVLDLRFHLAEITIVGEGQLAEDLARTARAHPFPLRVVRHVRAGEEAQPGTVLAARIAAAPKQGAAFICVGEKCSQPIIEPDLLRISLKNMMSEC